MRHLLISLALFSLLGCSTQKPVVHETTARPVSFSALKSLEGRWEGAKDAKGQKEIVVYRTTSGGQAVEETIFPGTDHEMVSVYYPADGTVGMTHYCMIGNRPQFRAEQIASDEIAFRYVPTAGINPEKDHVMDGVEMKFLGPKALFIKWSGRKDGQREDAKEVILKRVG